MVHSFWLLTLDSRLFSTDLFRTGQQFDTLSDEYNLHAEKTLMINKTQVLPRFLLVTLAPALVLPAHVIGDRRARSSDRLESDSHYRNVPTPTVWLRRFPIGY